MGLQVVDCLLVRDVRGRVLGEQGEHRDEGEDDEVEVPKLMVYKPIFMAWVDIKVADCDVAVALDEVMLSLSTASIALSFNVFFSPFLALAGTIGCTSSSVASVGVGEGAEPTLGGNPIF